MKKLWTGAAAAMLSIAAFANPLHVCYNIDSSTDYLAQATKGQMSLTGQICSDTAPPTYDLSTVSWNGTLKFTNFAPPSEPGFTANGSLSFNFQDDVRTGGLSVFYNGPVTYTYQGTAYNVVFNNLSLELTSTAKGLTASNVTGSVTINGSTLPADSWVWSFLF